MLSQRQVREPRSTATKHGKTTACTRARHTKKCSQQAKGQEQSREPQVCRWATPPYDLVVGLLSSAFQLACVRFCQQSEHRYAPSFAQARENDALQWDIFRGFCTKRFARCPSDNPFSMNRLPIGIVHFFTFIQRVLSPLSLGFPSSLASIAKPAGDPHCHFGRVWTPSHFAERYTSRLLHRLQNRCSEK